MSRCLMLLAMVALVALAPIRIRAADQPPPANQPLQASLIPNGGFEDVQETGDPRMWFGTRLPRTAGHVELSVSESQPHGGKRCVAVSIGQNHPVERVDYNWTIDAQGWQAGETYELSGWIKAAKAAQPAVIMTQFVGDIGGPILGGATSQKSSPILGSVDWTKVNVRFVVPEGTRIVRIRAGMSSAGNAGAKAWFDDVSLVKVAP